MARILFTGGGTLGSVTPLLALVSQLKKKGHEFVWIGTRTGPERQLVESMSIPFYGIVAPKLRRYISWRHLFLPIQALIAIVQTVGIMIRFRPEIVLSAGGFVAVPVAYVARCFGARSIVHQQDREVGLANRLLFPIADLVTTVFQPDLYDRPIRHPFVQWTGNPVRDLTPTTHFLAKKKPPIVLIFGGGTGALGINALVSEELCAFATVVHCTGAGKDGASFTHPQYIAVPFLNEEMKEALTCADVVVCRAGIGTLSELAFLHKAAIIIPLPNTHQELNAELLSQHSAAVVHTQATLTPQILTQSIKRLIENSRYRKETGDALAALFPHLNITVYCELVERVLSQK